MKKLLFLDTETTGLPMQPNEPIPPFTDLQAYNNCRLLQVAGILTYEDGTFIKSFSYYIRHDEKVVNRYPKNGITPQMIEKYGVYYLYFYDELQFMYRQEIRSINIICQNVDFDINVLKSEYFRIYCSDSINKVHGSIVNQYFDLSFNYFCTKKAFGEYFKANNIQTKRELPSLAEIYHHLFGMQPTSHHEALADAKTLCCIYFEGKKRGII